MTKRKKKWLLIISSALSLGFVALVIAGYFLSRRIDPYVRQQAILYLQRRFESEVELASLRSRSRNTPLAGRALRGAALLTLLGGEPTHDRDALLS